MRTVQLRFLALGTLAVAACSAGHLGGDPPPDPGVSPGTVMLQLTLPSTQSFCDVVSECGLGVSHVSFTTVSGQALDIGTRYCATECSTCTAGPCLAIPACTAPAVGQLITDVQTSWNGAYVESTSCGDGVACYSPRFVRPGRYVAHMCATPGTQNMPGDGGPPCTQTGDPECVDVPFDLPGPSLVTATLPSIELPPPPLR